MAGPYYSQYNLTEGAWETWTGTTSTGAWETWTANTIDCTTTTSASTDTIWVSWNTSSSTAMTTIWSTWSSDVVTIQNDAPVQTPEQRAAMEAAWEQQRAENQRAADEAMERRKAATARARALLEAVLDHKQREQLAKDRFFEVLARSGKLFRIHHGTHGNVRLVENGREVTRYCAQPYDVPIEDSMAAQKLMIETDEGAFMRVANATRM